MEPYLAIAATLTSLGGYLLARRWGGGSARDLRAALGRLMQCVGVVAVFAAVNFALGAALILAVRTFTPSFASLYLLDDALWVVVSALQGVAWSLWRADRADRG